MSNRTARTKLIRQVMSLFSLVHP